MVNSFSAQVNAIVLKNKQLLGMVARGSITDLIDQAQKPKAKGGSMPLDTGFLRASGQASYTGLPTGPVRGSGDPVPGNDPATIAKVAGLKNGMVLFFGWTAVYARKQNLYNGFLDKALMNWQSIVNANIRKLAGKL